MEYKKTYLDILLDFVYPRNIFCILCEKPIDKSQSYSICELCKNQIQWINTHECEKCGKPMDSLYIASQCPDCILVPHSFTKAFSCVVYDDVIKGLVYKLKYKGQRYLSYHMAEIMVDKLFKQDLPAIDVIVPVPLHSQKLRQREFNQAYLLAKHIGKKTGWPVEEQHLVRVKDTQSQNKLSKEERKQNMKNAFKLDSGKQLKGKNILLVDDIYTTGSTLDACSKELQKSEPQSIIIMTFTTGRNT